MKPFGSVGDQVRPPSKLTLYAQPSFKLKSLAPVRMLFALRGLTAIGVSSWAAVSRLTSVTNTAGPRPAAAKLGRAGAVGAGASAQATTPAAMATRVICITMLRIDRKSTRLN